MFNRIQGIDKIIKKMITRDEFVGLNWLFSHTEISATQEHFDMVLKLMNDILELDLQQAVNSSLPSHSRRYQSLSHLLQAMRRSKREK